MLNRQNMDAGVAGEWKEQSGSLVSCLIAACEHICGKNMEIGLTYNDLPWLYGETFDLETRPAASGKDDMDSDRDWDIWTSNPGLDNKQSCGNVAEQEFNLTRPHPPIILWVQFNPPISIIC
jgi:hypothetical protein